MGIIVLNKDFIMQTENILPDDHPLVLALSDFNGIPYRQFYGYDFAYETWGTEDIINGFYFFFSYVYAVAPFYMLGNYWKIFRGEIDLSELKFFRKIAYVNNLALNPGHIFYYNGVYMFQRFMALTTTALAMYWSWPVFVVYKFFRGRSFDFDFDEIEEEGKKYSNKQGLVYHYWGDSRYQTWVAAYIVHCKDAALALVGVIPWIILNVIYWPAMGINLLLFPVFAAVRLITPWKEQEYENAYLWFSGAVEAGIDPGFPDNVYTNKFLIPKAEEIRQKEYDEALEKMAEKAEKEAEKAAKD